jgi:hypothetical protein
MSRSGSGSVPSTHGAPRSPPHSGRTGSAAIQREGQRLLLHRGRGRVRHQRRLALARPQDLQPEAEQAPPGVVGRRVIPHRPAGGAHVAEFGGQGEGAQAEAEPRIIGSHGGAPWGG